jgi:diguanylate cyclase (GGDEF)-like protein
MTMPPEDPALDSHVLAALQKAGHLPSVPSVVLEVLRVARNQEANTEELAAVISLDPALTANILKLSNSALLGRSCEIVNLKRACAQLGFNTVKLWALSFAVVEWLEDPRTEGFDYDGYWRRGVFRAVSAKLISETAAPELAEEAFITGMLSRIGQLVLACCQPSGYKAVQAASRESCATPEIERNVLGYTTDELSVAFLRFWGLPALIYQAVHGAQQSEQIREDLPAATRKLARSLAVALRCEALVSRANKAEALAELQQSAKGFFGLEPAAIEQLLAQADQHTNEITQVLPAGSTRSDTAVVVRGAQVDVLRQTIELLRDAVIHEQRATQLEFENSLLALKARTDSLTGLANRGALQSALDGNSSRTTGHCAPRVGLLMIDIDHFKQVNDNYGHQAGDQVLQMIARTLRESTRSDDLAARYGGDEFAVLMPRSSAEGLKRAAERLRAEISKLCIATSKGPLSVEVSIGGSHAEIIGTPISPHELIEYADRFLYAAKKCGRDRCCFGDRDAMPVETGPVGESVPNS